MNKGKTLKRHKNQAVGVAVGPPGVFRSPITQWRMEHGVTMDTLANLLGVDISTVSRWEAGETYPKTLMCLLMEYLSEGEVSMYELVSPEEVIHAQEALKVIDDFKEKNGLHRRGTWPKTRASVPVEDDEA